MFIVKSFHYIGAHSNGKTTNGCRLGPLYPVQDRNFLLYSSSHSYNPKLTLGPRQIGNFLMEGDCKPVASLGIQYILLQRTASFYLSFFATIITCITSCLRNNDLHMYILYRCSNDLLPNKHSITCHKRVHTNKPFCVYFVDHRAILEYSSVVWDPT